jgi:hypothetical protein
VRPGSLEPRGSPGKQGLLELRGQLVPLVKQAPQEPLALWVILGPRAQWEKPGLPARPGLLAPRVRQEQPAPKAKRELLEQQGSQGRPESREQRAPWVKQGPLALLARLGSPERQVRSEKPA